MDRPAVDLCAAVTLQVWQGHISDWPIPSVVKRWRFGLAAVTLQVWQGHRSDWPTPSVVKRWRFVLVVWPVMNCTVIPSVVKRWRFVLVEACYEVCRDPKRGEEVAVCVG